MLAEQLAVFLLKRASAMVLLLGLDVLQHGIKLAAAHRKGGIAALPEKGTIARVKLFDPFRGRFLYLLDQLSLGNSSWQRRDNVNVISNTADAYEFGAPRSRQIVARYACMRSRTSESRKCSRFFVLKAM